MIYAIVGFAFLAVLYSASAENLAAESKTHSLRASAGKNIDLAWTFGSTTQVCVPSLAALPAGWVVTQAGGAGGNCPSNYYYLHIRDLNHVPAALPETVNACIQQYSQVPEKWFVTGSSTTSLSCPHSGEESPFFGVNLKYLGSNAVDNQGVCVSSLSTLPPLYVATKTSSASGHCPPGLGPAVFISTSRLPEETDQNKQICIASLSQVPTGWVAVGLQNVPSTCAASANVHYVRATVTALKGKCGDCPNPSACFQTFDQLPAGYLPTAIHNDASACTNSFLGDCAAATLEKLA